VIASAEVLILGKAWPIVSDLITSHAGANLGGAAALITTLTALPGLVLFAATLPFTVEIIIGRKGSTMQRPAEILSTLAAATWILLPVVSML